MTAEKEKKGVTDDAHAHVLARKLLEDCETDALALRTTMRDLLAAYQALISRQQELEQRVEDWRMWAALPHVAGDFSLLLSDGDIRTLVRERLAKSAAEGSLRALRAYAKHQYGCGLLVPVSWCRPVILENGDFGGLQTLSSDERAALEAERKCTCGLDPLLTGSSQTPER